MLFLSSGGTASGGTGPIHPPSRSRAMIGWAHFKEVRPQHEERQSEEDRQGVVNRPWPGAGAGAGIESPASIQPPSRSRAMMG